MNQKLFNPDYLRFLCETYGLKPSQRYGQNFLINSEPVEKMVEAVGPSRTDTVVEVGPGFGALTFALAEKAGKVVSFEIEKKIEGYWKKNKPENVEIIWGNVLREFDFRSKSGRGQALCGNDSKKVVIPDQDRGSTVDSRLRGNDNEMVVIPDLIGDPHTPCHPRECGDPAPLHPTTSSHISGKYKVAANLPYQITSDIIRKFLEADNPPQVMAVMTQKEVAERICAEPGQMSVLAIATQYYARPEIVALVDRSNFWPEPKVDSAILKLQIIKQNIDKEARDNFFKIVHAGFAQKRKLLAKNLGPLFKDKMILAEIFKNIGLEEKARAQELSLEQWKAIVEYLPPRIK